MLWNLPIRTVQAAGMLFLLKTKLPVRSTLRRTYIAVWAALALAEFAVMDVMTASALLFVIAFVALNCVTGLACFGSLRGLRIMWWATGCSAIFLAHLAATSLTTCTGLATTFEAHPFLPDLLQTPLETATIAGALAPLCYMRRAAIDIPSDFVDFSGAACALLSVLIGWSVYAPGTMPYEEPLYGLSVAACIGLGLLTIAFVFLLQHLGRYYARQTRMQLDAEEARFEENARQKREKLIRCLPHGRNARFVHAGGTRACNRQHVSGCALEGKSESVPRARHRAARGGAEFGISATFRACYWHCSWQHAR